MGEKPTCSRQKSPLGMTILNISPAALAQVRCSANQCSQNIYSNLDLYPTIKAF